MDASPNTQSRGGRNRGRRNGNNNAEPKPAGEAKTTHVDPTAARPAADRREQRGPARPAADQKPAPAAAAAPAAANAEGDKQRRPRNRGGRKNGTADETAAKPAEAAQNSFNVTADAAPAAAPAPAATAGSPAVANAAFEKLGLIPELVRATVDLGYKGPTPIQVQAIPKVLAGKDVLAGAQTGTGKTAAFSLPILQLLTKKYIVDGKAPAAPARGQPLRVLVLTPTRELAAQVHDNIRDLSKYLPRSFFSTTVIVGGVGQAGQVAELKKRPTVLVATPGRLLDFHQQGGIVDLSQIEFCVLDEADRMLDMGFYPDVSKILALLPKDKQSLLFSATFTPDIRQLAGKILRGPVVEVQVTPPNSTVERIQQSYYLVGRDQKDDALTHIIETNKWSQVLVFTRQKSGANRVSTMLAKKGITSLALHGGKSQTARTQALADFKSGKLRVLVATDIAARGLDIEDLPHVVNYEIPNVSEDYVHRIGRTGRAGKLGFAVSLVSLDEEGFLNSILKFAGNANIPRKNDLPAAFSPAKDETAQPIAMGRMTLWGGAGPMPSKAVMDAAGKEKRKEIAANIRERKDKEREAQAAKAARSGANAAANNARAAPAASGNGGGRGGAAPAGGRGGNGGGRGGNNGGTRRGGRGF